MQKSTNYELNLPDLADQFNLNHWNENTRKLDLLIKNNENNIETINSGLSSINLNENSVYFKLMQLIYPIGSLYWSSKNTNPSTLFGGTWVQIKDKFILACGDTYTNGATGGSSTVTLTVNQIPSHAHTGPNHAHSFTPSGSVSAHAHGLNNHTHTFTPSGSVSSHTHTISHTHSFITNAGGFHNHRALVYTGESLSEIGNMYGYNSDSSNTPDYWCLTGNGAPNPWDGDDDTSVVNRVNKKTAGYARYANWGAKRNNSYKREIIESGGSHNHTGTTYPASVDNTGVSTPTFTGTLGTTKGSTADTANATPTFIGTQGTTNFAGTGYTSSIGGGTPHDNMPPYVVKYCWERTK